MMRVNEIQEETLRRPEISDSVTFRQKKDP